MKAWLVSALKVMSLSLALGTVRAQAPGDLPPLTLRGPGYDQTAEKGPHHRRWTVVETVSKPGGRPSVLTRNYVELQTGLHYWENGQWLESKEIIEINERGAVARHGQHKVIFSPDLRTAGAIDLLAADGKRFRSHVLGLSYFDAASGRSALIAEVKKSLGELLPPNQMIYRDAFTEIEADVRYTYTKAGFEQEVILREEPPAPESWGLNGRSTRLEVLTEFLQPPLPEKNSRTLRRETDPRRRRAMVEPDSIDENLDFGAMRIGPGRAFDLEAGPAEFLAKPEPSMPVAKRWQKLEGRDFLIESVEYEAIKPLLISLPKQKTAQRDPPRFQRPTSGRRNLPKAVASASAGHRIASAALPYGGQGVVLDYSAVFPAGGFTFRKGATYFLSGDLALAGTTIVEGGTVLKYAPNSSLVLYGAVDCRTSDASPAFLTSADDNSAGEALGTGRPSGLSASRLLWLSHLPGKTELKHLKLRHAQTAIQYDADGGDNAALVVRDAIFGFCQTGISATAAAVTLSGLGMCDVRVNYSGDNKSTFSIDGISSNCAASLGEALDQPDLPWSTGGAAGWQGQSWISDRETGSAHAAQSGALSANQSSFLETSFAGPGSVGFRWKVSSEEGADFLKLSIDGIEHSRVSGNRDWAEQRISLPSGSHALRWEYTKDQAVDGGADAGWVDRLQFTPMPVPAAAPTTSANGGDSARRAAVALASAPRAANRAPVVTLASGSASYLENAALALVEGNAAFSDPDSPDLDGGTLTLEISANGQGEDRLGIRNVGAGKGQIGVSAPSVMYQAVEIGSYSGGTGTTPLAIAFNKKATPAGVQALLRNLIYWNTSDNPVKTARTIKVTVSDGDGGTSQPKTRTMNVTPVNDLPVMSLPGGPVAYTENDPPTVIDSGATVSDVDSPDFNLGRLTVDFILNGHKDDRLGIRQDGTGPGQIGISASSVTYQGGAIGSWSGGTGLTPLVIAFNSAATPAIAQVLARNITYSNASDFIATAPRTVRMLINDGDGGVSTPVTKMITITPANDPPVITLATPPLTYLENASPVSVDGTALLSDDSASFDGGVVTVQLSANGQAEDRLGIRQQGIGAGQIGLSGTSVMYQNGAIGSYAGGAGTTPLVVTLNGSATPLATQALLRNITYANVSDNPVRSPRTVQITVSDGTAPPSLPKTRTINITPVNDIPVMSLPGGPVGYTENDPPTILEEGATVSDVDSLDFNAGRLIADFVLNSHADDRLGIRNQGTDAGQIGLAGTKVTYEGLNIGTVSGGTGSSPLVVLFNGSATPAIAQALARNITYSNVSDFITVSPRTVRMAVNDGDGGLSVAVTKTVNITRANDPPIVTLAATPLVYIENAAPLNVDGTAKLADDSASFDGGVLTVEFSANGQGEDRLGIRHHGNGNGQIGIAEAGVTYQGAVIASFSGGVGITPLVVSFTAGANPMVAQALVRNITYSNVSDNPVLAARIVQITVSDGSGAASSPKNRTIKITPINDIPAMTLTPEPLNYTENDAPTVIDSAAAVSDVDSPDFHLGRLTVVIGTNGHADDRLGIGHDGVGREEIGLSGAQVTYQGTAIGTLSGGLGLSPLIVVFNSAATPAAAQALARRITFSNVSDFITTTPRTVRMVVNDGDGGVSVAVAKTIAITPANDPPILTLATTPLTCVENAVPTSVDASAALADDSAHFEGGMLKVEFVANGQAEDRLGIRHQGLGANQMGLSGTSVLYQGAAIGTLDGGVGTTPLVVKLNAAATPLITQALVRNITYWNVSDNPILDLRTVQIIVSDGHGGTSAPKTRLIKITPLNDPPAMSLPGDPLSYTENDPPTVIDGAATVADIDSADFNLGRLIVDFSRNGHADDRLGIRNQGASTGEIGLSGNSVAFEGINVGTSSGGFGLSPLVIVFNSAATPAIAQALARNITYSNASDFITIVPRTVRMVVNDGDGGVSVAVTKTIAITPVNDPPIVTLAATPLIYRENAPAITVDGTATLVDDSVNFEGGTLTVEFIAHGQSEDRLEIRSLGGGAGQIGLSDLNVIYQGKAIGSFSGGVGTTPLVVNFNNSATPVITLALLRNITYSNVSDNPVLNPRTLQVTVHDGSDGTSQPKTRTINITPVNDLPVISLPGGPVFYAENAPPTVIDRDAVVSDVDSVDFNSGRLTVDFTLNGHPDDRLGIRNQGPGAGEIGLSGAAVTWEGTTIGTVSGGVGLSPLLILFNSAATPATAQALARSLTYSNSSDAITIAPRTVRMVLNDGDGGVSGPATKTINITASNELPIITLSPGAVSYTESATAAIIDGSATVADIDSPDFDGGTLTIEFTENGRSEDRLGVRNQGSGGGQIGVSDSNLTYQGVVIGSFSGGLGTAPLVINFNSASSPAKVQALARNIAYSSAAGIVSLAPRTVRFVLADGDGGTSLPAFKTINIVPNVSVDSDSDGMPDSWEHFYFGSLAQIANGDWDADGITNLQEYKIGTDPIAELSLQIFTPLE